MSRKLALPLAVGCAVSGAALYMALKNVPFSELADYVAGVNVLWLIPATVATLGSFGLRAIRWRLILSESRDVTVVQAFHPMMIGFMINCVLPGRAGEIVRPAVLRNQTGVPFTTGLATLAAERVFDLMVLLGFLAVVFYTVDMDPDLAIPFGDRTLDLATLKMINRNMVRLSVLLLCGITAILIPAGRRMMIRVIRSIPAIAAFAGEPARSFVERRMCEPAVAIIENIATGFLILRSPAKAAACMGISIVVWLLMGISYRLVAAGCPGVGLTFWQLLAVMIIACFFIALPSVPGFWGIWEAGGVFAMALFGVGPATAAGYTLVNHAVQVFPVIFTGLASAMITGVRIRKVALEGYQG